MKTTATNVSTTATNVSPYFWIKAIFNQNEFDDFCDFVHGWTLEYGDGVCHWSLYSPSKNSLSKVYWDNYVKNGKKIAVLEGNGKIYAAIVMSDGTIDESIGVFDNRDVKISDKISLDKIQSKIYSGINDKGVTSLYHRNG
jgi:hypothetical protein